MKTFGWLIIISLGANALLAGYWFKSGRSAVATTTESANSIAADSSRSGRSSKVSQGEATTTVQSDVGTAAITSWEAIQSADLKELIRHLRNVGCPEETIKDMIVADVNRRYAARSRELWPDRYKQQTEFWRVEKRDPEAQKKNREQWRKDRQLQKEKSALLVELLGVDPEKELRREEGFDEPMDWRTRQLAFLPESKREAVTSYLEAFDERSQEMYERNRGIWDAQSRAEQKQLEADKLAGLAAILTPQELREYELRQSQMASQLSQDLRSLTLTREQYESVFDTRKKYGDSIYNYGDLDKDASQQVEATKKALKEDLTASLGADFVKQYERSQDYQYQQLTRLAKKNELPANTANQVYDYKSTAEDSVKKLRDNKDLSNEDRQVALQQIRTETETTLKQTLGEKAYKSYLNNGGWWINNLAPAPRPNTSQRPAAVTQGFNFQ